MIATDLSENLTAAALVLTSLLAGVAALVGVIINRRVKDVDANTQVMNGRSLGILAELAEGRRIRDTILPSERTAREQMYVDLLEKVEKEGSDHEKSEDLELKLKGEEGKGPQDRKGNV